MKAVKFHRSAHGTIGCTIGLAPHLYVGAYGEDAADALSQAGQIASKVQSYIDKDPKLAAALAVLPGGALAFGAIAAASSLYKSGLTAKDVVNAVGPTAANVVHKLLSLFGGG